MINARSETAGAKPAFRDALRFRRCLVPADGFYEWSQTGKAKQPYCFEVNEGELFAFAGIAKPMGVCPEAGNEQESFLRVDGFRHGRDHCRL